jgi:hypothetical protein
MRKKLPTEYDRLERKSAKKIIEGEILEYVEEDEGGTRDPEQDESLSMW